jgi:glutamate/tyrosine decarboxylase-like PLP-dependent enzyme
MDEMHRYTDETEALSRAIVAYARTRIASPQPLDGSATGDELTSLAGETITPEGIGGEEALRVWSEVLAPATISTDHPSSMAFVPGAPTKAAVLFDLVVGASSTIAAGWIDGAGAIWAENQALRWLADLAGFPGSAGGAFVSGGSAGNLSALVAARAQAAERLGARPATGWTIAVADSVHSSVATAARVIDVGIVRVTGDERGRLRGEALASALDALDPEEATSVFAVVASAGATNAGTVDDLAGVADVCSARGIWFHVDGAYGGAGLVAPTVRERYRGIERADSFIIDPHKWLFAPYDCCALVYRDPTTAHGVFRQEASYLDTVNQPGAAWSEWNPADYAYHLTRRARGLPLWFSIATYGTDAYRDAVERVLSLTRETAEEIRARDDLELVMDPELSVVLFRRLGWSDEDYEAWWRRLLEAQIAFVQPTSWKGEKLARLCFVNPRTTIDHVRAVLGTMAS